MQVQSGPGSANPLVSDLRRSGLVTLLVLHYVASEACYGNQLIERIAALTSGAVAVNPNTMYPLLRALEESGLVSAACEQAERSNRRCYQIPDAGHSEPS